MWEAHRWWSLHRAPSQNNLDKIPFAMTTIDDKFTSYRNNLGQNTLDQNIFPWVGCHGNRVQSTCQQILQQRFPRPDFLNLTRPPWHANYGEIGIEKNLWRNLEFWASRFGASMERFLFGAFLNISGTITWPRRPIFEKWDNLRRKFQMLSNKNIFIKIG